MLRRWVSNHNEFVGGLVRVRNDLSQPIEWPAFQSGAPCPANAGGASREAPFTRRRARIAECYSAMEADRIR